MSIPPIIRIPAATRSALVLDGAPAGIVSAASGGEAAAQVISEPPDAQRLVKKHLGPVRYEDITLTCGAGMTAAYYQWIKDALSRVADQHNGAIITLDTQSNVLGRLDFFGARLCQVSFPRVDAAARDPGTIAVKLTPERTRLHRQPGGSLAIADAPPSWLRANFRLRIGGLEDACAHVMEIAPLVIWLVEPEPAIGEPRPDPKSTVLEVPNLAITVPATHAEPLYAWHEDFVINGNNGEEREKIGTLEYLGADLQQPLFTLALAGLGIFRISQLPNTGSPTSGHVRAEMYCQAITFDYHL